MSRDRIIAVLTTALASDRDVHAAWLFGSVARRDDRPGSDIDVAVLPAPAAARSFDQHALEADLAKALGRDVQVVNVLDAPADLVHRILRDGILLRDADRSARIRFEVEQRNRYFDMTPIWNEYRAARPAR
jgi:predicted nucleotidyltransferase